MSDSDRAQPWLIYAAAIYALAFVIHTGDHVRRGLAVETTQVLVLGNAAAVFQVLAIAAVFARHRFAPVLAVAVGFPDAVGIAAVHLLPHWSSFSDAFPNAHGTGVTGLSWVAAIAEVGGAVVFGLAGLNAMRQARRPAVALPHG